MSFLRSSISPASQTATAAAGVANVLGVAVLNAVLAAGLSRLASPTNYAAWLLFVQVASGLSVFEFGMNQVVTRRVASLVAKSDLAMARSELRSSMKLAAMSAATVLVIGIVFRAWLTSLLRVSVDSWAVILFVLSAAATIVSAPLHGYLRGISRLPTSVAVLLITRAVAYLGVIAMALWRDSVQSFGYVLAAASLAAVPVLMRLASFSLSSPHRGGTALRGLVSEGLPISLSSLSVLLITGADVIVVGRYDPPSVIGYANGGMIVALATSFQWAVFAGVPQRAAAMSANGQSDELRRYVVRLSRIGIFAIAWASGVLVWILPLLLRTWLHRSLPDTTIAAIRILLLATVIRNLFTVWYLAILGTGDYLKTRRVPYLEASVNLVCSVLLARRFGAIGVAGGTFIGALTSSACYLSFGLRRTSAFSIDPRALIGSAIAPSVLAASPLFLLLAVYSFTSTEWLRLSSLVILGAVSLRLGWLRILADIERGFAVSALKKVWRTHRQKASPQR
jgi:O-antigen/teichoic acid export membrane protein